MHRRRVVGAVTVVSPPSALKSETKSLIVRRVPVTARTR
jgi:hypothetical protein